MADGYKSLLSVVITIIWETHSKFDHVLFSGGHFNPVVSLSIYMCGGMELRLLLPYALAQMFGGMIGAGLVKVRKNYEAHFCLEKKSW